MDLERNNASSALCSIFRYEYEAFAKTNIVLKYSARNKTILNVISDDIVSKRFSFRGGTLNRVAKKESKTGERKY